jgi:hypothetical protein
MSIVTFEADIIIDGVEKQARLYEKDTAKEPGLP